MRYLALYGFMLFVGLPMIIFGGHIATMPDDKKEDLKEVAKDLNGRIYTARIDCNRASGDHMIRIHGRNRDDARRKIQARVPDCNVDILEEASAPIWQKALRSSY